MKCKSEKRWGGTTKLVLHRLDKKEWTLPNQINSRRPKTCSNGLMQLE